MPPTSIDSETKRKEAPVMEFPLPLLVFTSLMSGRVGSWRDPFDGQVSSLVDFAIPLLRRGAETFIATVTGYPYLNPLSSLLLTILLHLTMSSVVLAVDRTTADPSMPMSGRLPRVGSVTLAGQLSEGARTWQPGQYLSYQLSSSIT
ncbi:hypothetical protein GW17_00038204 [Ensete ventricosum]|nr:hypothetical protein GW17_00038204 [Ensete ventricosum]